MYVGIPARRVGSRRLVENCGQIPLANYSQGMNIPAETVQVQLVNAWWEQMIPLAAILISLFAVGLTLCFRFLDRLNLVVDTSRSIFVGGAYDAGEGADRINVRVTNKSPTVSTHITSLTLELPNGHTFTWADAGPSDDKLPKVLGPGESASVSYPALGLGIVLQQRKSKWVRAHAVSGHKTVRGKKSRTMVTNLRTYAIEHSSSP